MEDTFLAKHGNRIPIFIEWFLSAWGRGEVNGEYNTIDNFLKVINY